MGEANQQQVTVYAQEWFWETLDGKRREPTFYSIHPTTRAANEFLKENVRRWEEYCSRHLTNPKANKRKLKKLIGKDHPVGTVFETQVDLDVYEDLTGSTSNIYNMQYLICAEVRPKVILLRDT